MLPQHLGGAAAEARWNDTAAAYPPPPPDRKLTVKKLAATRQLDSYNPEHELRTSYPDWQIHTAPPGALAGNWVSFQPNLKIAVVDPYLTFEDRAFAVAFVVALLDAGAVHVGMKGISPEVLGDAEDIATMRLGGDPFWSLDRFPLDGPPSVMR